MAQDILITPGSGEPQILFRGSGTTDTAVELNVLSSYQSGTGSGTAILFEGTEGQLFGITDNLSSGTIFSVADITGLPTIEVNSDGQVILCEYGSGTIIYNDFIGNDSLIHISGVNLGASGVRFSDGTTQTTAATDTNTQLSTEEVQDIAGPLVATGGTKTGITITYDDANNDMDFVVDSYTAGSGLTLVGTEFNVYGGSGNFQQVDVTSDNTFMPKMVFTGSGVTDTPVTMKVLSSFGSVSTSGTALSFEGTQGQLFGITDNLSSGNIFTVNDINGLPLISANADGDVKLAEYGRYILSYGGYVQESVPASDTPTTEDATITLDLSAGNYHNVVLGADVTKFEFTNAKRGQRFLLRITQHASSAKTVAWTDVDYTTGGAAAVVRWAGGGTAPTMSTSTSHTDVYDFLCTNNAGSAFDGFVVGQNLPD